MKNYHSGFHRLPVNTHFFFEGKQHFIDQITSIQSLLRASFFNSDGSVDGASKLRAPKAITNLPMVK